MKRYIALALISIGMVLIAVAMLVFTRQGRLPSSTDGYERQAKLQVIRPLQRLKGERPFTEREMQLLRQFVKDPDFTIRARALSALSYTPDPNQRKEAIQLAIGCLNDEWSSVRVYALRLLARQKAHEAVPHILPLLNSPNPVVREEAKKTLQQLGYTVH